MSSALDKAYEREEQQALARETKRLEKPVFQTMVEPLSEETKQKLRGWKEPPRAYIMLERKVREMNDDGAIHWDIMEINAEGRPTHCANKLSFYVLGKGWRVLHYGNFPKLDDKNAQRAKLARIHIDPDTGRSAWDSLEAEVKKYMVDHDPGKQQKQIDDLQAKLEAAERRAAELEGKASKPKAKNEQAISA